ESDHGQRVEAQVLAQAVGRGDLRDVSLEVLGEGDLYLAGDHRLRGHHVLPFGWADRLSQRARARAWRGATGDGLKTTAALLLPKPNALSRAARSGRSCTWWAIAPRRQGGWGSS